MDDLLCLCGHPVSEHIDGGCLNRCDCDLTEAQALRAAQRKAAARHLVVLRRERDSWHKIYVVGYFESTARISGAVMAYRAVGVLGRKGAGR